LCIHDEEAEGGGARGGEGEERGDNLITFIPEPRVFLYYYKHTSCK